MYKTVRCNWNQVYDISSLVGEDYVFIEEEICFNPEDNMKPVLIPLINNQVNEPDKYFTVSLMLPAGQLGVQLGGDTVRVNVMDDDGGCLVVQTATFCCKCFNNATSVRLIYF